MSQHVCNEIVIVACHAIYVCGDVNADDSWVLLPFQKNNGHVERFLQHIDSGLEFVRRNSHTLLVFSGGISRPDAPTSEADSYLRVAKQRPAWSNDSADRVTSEEYARDSYENLLFGIASGYANMRQIPRRITVIGFSFKKSRFEFHARTMGLRIGRDAPGSAPIFEYWGVNDPADMEGPTQGERTAMDAFLADPHGIDKDLMQKRQTRNPKMRSQPYGTVVSGWPQLKGLLDINARSG